MAQTNLLVNVETGSLPGAEKHKKKIRQDVTEALQNHGCCGPFEVRLTAFAPGSGSTKRVHFSRDTADNEPYGVGVKLRPKGGSQRFEALLLPQHGERKEREQQIQLLRPPLAGGDGTSEEFQSTEEVEEPTEDPPPLSWEDEIVRDPDYVDYIREILERTRGKNDTIGARRILNAVRRFLRDDGRDDSKQSAECIRNRLIAEGFFQRADTGRGQPTYVMTRKMRDPHKRVRRTLHQ